MENDKIDLRKYINAIKRGWVFGSISALCILALAVTWCFLKMPQFNSTAMMLIENDSDNSPRTMGGMGALMRTFSIGGFGSSSIDNEVVIAQSHSVKKSVSSRLGLNRTYLERNGLAKTFLYKNSPVRVEAPAQLFDTLQTSFKIRFEIDGDKVDVKATKGMFGKVLAEKKGVVLPCSLETPYGIFQLMKTDHYVEGMNKTIDVVVSGDELVVSNMGEDILNVNYHNKKSNVIELNIVDPSKERGCDILNTVMTVYNEKRKNRRNETAEAEAEFLDGRIALLSKELNDAENKVASFKKDNNLVDIGAEVSVLFHKDKATDTEMLELTVQRSMLESILAQLKNPEKDYSLIPLSESLGDAGASSVIRSYNELILKRMAVSESAKSDNIVLKSLTERIDALRENAIENVNRTLENLQIKYDSAKEVNVKNRGRLNTLPQYEQEYVDLMRDKELKNALYMFLLEKRESAMLKLNNNQELGFVFEPAYSALKTNKQKIYLILGIGFACALVSFVVVSLVWGYRRNKKD